MHEPTRARVENVETVLATRVDRGPAVAQHGHDPIPAQARRVPPVGPVSSYVSSLGSDTKQALAETGHPDASIRVEIDLPDHHARGLRGDVWAAEDVGERGPVLIEAIHSGGRANPQHTSMVVSQTHHGSGPEAVVVPWIVSIGDGRAGLGVEANQAVLRAEPDLPRPALTHGADS